MFSWRNKKNIYVTMPLMGNIPTYHKMVYAKSSDLNHTSPEVYAVCHSTDQVIFETHKSHNLVKRGKKNSVQNFISFIIKDAASSGYLL